MTPEKRRRPLTRASKSPGPSKVSEPPMAPISSSDSSSGELVIDAEDYDDTTKNSSPNKDESTDGQPKRVFRRKRRKISLPCDDDELFDAKFEETIRKSAAKNNLTPNCVKRLLKKLVMNDHVFAMVRLKEEEEEMKNCNINEEPQEAEDGDDEDDDEENAHTLPKLTRLKARQLNQTLFPLVPLNAPATDKDVAALIREELNSDDDDEEYKPGEDDVPSDDDPNTTISDIDSQPRTPAATVALAGIDTEPDLQYTKDGLFKIPKPRNDSYCSQSEQEQENIALRTRSKLCLTTTDIETLESTFVPPDITTDMYEYDGDMDQAWKDFLEEFTKPLPQGLEDDDDNDPEYVAADKVPLDAEEMRVVKVSKKELNELVSELMEMSNIDEPYLEQALNETINESLSCTQIENRSDILRTPLPEPTDEQNNTVSMQSTYSTLTEKLPVLMPLDPNVTIESQNGHCDNSFGAQNLSVMAPSYTSTPHIPVHRISGARDLRHDNIVHEYAETTQPPKVIPSDVQSNSISSTYNQYDSLLNKSRFFIRYPLPHERSEIPDLVLKPTPTGAKELYFHKTDVPVNVELPDEPVGFTDFQMHLFQQQLQMHVQLTTQHFLQCYAHPLYWEKASTCKKMLNEIEAATKLKPSIIPWNLSFAQECCQSWEDELSVVNESNKLYIKHLDEEIIQAEHGYRSAHKHRQSEFHWRIKEKILNCRAFLYPSLVPSKTFRILVKDCKNQRFTMNELHLIAFWFERAYESMREEHNIRHPNTVMKAPNLRSVCNYIVANFYSGYNMRQLDALMYNKMKKIPGNPIQFFLKNGHAPPFKQVLEYIDFDNVKPLLLDDKELLPPNWKRYIAARTVTPISNELKEELSVRTIKDEQGQQKQKQQHQPPSNTVGETADDTSLQCKIRVLLPEEQNTASSPVDSAAVISINEAKCESATGGVVEPPQGGIVMNTNPSDISFSAVLLDEPNYSKDMHSDVACTKSSTSAVDRVIFECPCSCHSSVQSVTVDANEELPDRISHRDEQLVDSSNTEDNNAISRQPAFQSSTSNGSPSSHNKNVAKHSINRLAASACLYITLKRYLKELKVECKQNSASMLSPSHPVGKVYLHFLQLEMYSRFLDGLRKMCENIASYCHRYRTLQQYNPQLLSGFLQLSHFQHVKDGSLVVSARYVSQRFDDYCSMEDKDALFAFNYYEKVEETLLAAGRPELLERFEELLRKFNELEDRATQLYYQVEELFGESFSELVDMFLTFLLPGQAAEVGRFFEHFILTNMGDFLEKLNIYFAKQPSQIKKIHACLNELSNEPNVTMEQVKLKVLPLLKGSTLLTEWFLQLFPNERPPESPLCDYEHVTLKKPPLMDTCEPGVVYEHVPYVETASESTESAAPPNAIRYIQGRIYQGAFPARLTFLAQSCLTKSGSAPDASSNLEQNLCDDATLKAHAIRLNPVLYCPKGNSYANVVPSSTADADAGLGASRDVALDGVHTEEESKDVSPPKKIPPKLPIKKRFNSPTSRKLTFSPNEERPTATSPSKESAAVLKKVPSAPVAVPADSKALSTTKKLKSIMEAEPARTQGENKQATPLVTPPVYSSTTTKDGASSEPTTNGAIVSDESIETPVAETVDNPSASASEAPSWTREEDEIILLKIVKGYTSVDAFVQLIEQHLPERSNEQIRCRVEFLNEMLRRVNGK